MGGLPTDEIWKKHYEPIFLPLQLINYVNKIDRAGIDSLRSDLSDWVERVGVEDSIRYHADILAQYLLETRSWLVDKDMIVAEIVANPQVHAQFKELLGRIGYPVLATKRFSTFLMRNVMLGNPSFFSTQYPNGWPSFATKIDEKERAEQMNAARAAWQEHLLQLQKMTKTAGDYKVLR